jgi:hypothetical protein
VDAHFSYLQTTFGFRLAKVDASSAWVTRLVYKSSTTAVYVDRSFEFKEVEVSLIRLVDGAIPEYPVFITPDLTLHQFSLYSILSVRAPETRDKVRALAGLEDWQIEQRLALQARALEEHAADVLKGDFSIFSTLEARLKQSVKEHPQVITVWLPEDASSQEEATLVERARQDTPTQPVVVERYVRPSRRRRKRKGEETDTSGDEPGGQSEGPPDVH